MNGTGLRLRLTDQAARALGLKRRMPATNEGNQLARELRYALLTLAKLRSPERTRSFTKAGPGRMHGGKARPDSDAQPRRDRARLRARIAGPHSRITSMPDPVCPVGQAQ